MNLAAWFCVFSMLPSFKSTNFAFVSNSSLYTFLSTKTKLAKSNSLKFDITFYTDGIVNQVLKFFNGSSEYTLDEISAYSKRIFNILFNEKNPL